MLSAMGAVLAALGLGILIGLLLGPLLRAVLAAREYRRASAEVRLTDEVLRRMGAPAGAHAPDRSS